MSPADGITALADRRSSDRLFDRRYPWQTLTERAGVQLAFRPPNHSQAQARDRARVRLRALFGWWFKLDQPGRAIRELAMRRDARAMRRR